MRRTNWFDYFHLAFLVITPIVVLLLPADYFDTGPVLCPSKRFLDIECLGCGMTRAVMHLVHFDFDSAIYYNKLSFIVAPVLGAYWLLWIRKVATKIKNARIAAAD